MRIAMVGPFGFRPKKTMRARAFRLARALVERGHTVALFMPPWHTPEESDRSWQEDGVTLRYIPLHGGLPAIAYRLTRESLAWQPDILHCFKPKAYSGLTAAWAWQTRRRPRVVIDSDDWEGWGGWNELESYSRPVKAIFARQERWGLRHCHALTVASRALQTLAWGQGVTPARVVYLPNGPGIEPTAAPPAPVEGPPSLLLYTRFFEFDVARLVEIIRRARAQQPALRVWLVGASLRETDGARFEQAMRAAGAWECVQVVGWLEEAALPAALTQAQVGLYLMDDTLLNRAKCPVKLADMAALGLPVVGEAVGQVSEYVQHGQSGWLHPSGDIDGITASLLRLWADSAERARFSRHAYDHIQANFAWSRLAADLEQAYQRALQS